LSNVSTNAATQRAGNIADRGRELSADYKTTATNRANLESQYGRDVAGIALDRGAAEAQAHTGIGSAQAQHYTNQAQSALSNVQPGLLDYVTKLYGAGVIK
jgi:hypothetical protein